MTGPWSSPERVAVVTGGGSGIGLAIASGLAPAGYRCVLVGRRAGVLESAAASLDGPGGFVVADLAETDSPDRVAAEVLSTHGRLDVLVHAAGVFEKRPVADTDLGHWHMVMRTNLTAVMQLTRACWDALREAHGQVVLVSSIAATQAFPENSAYAASKGGLNALGEVLRLEGRPHGIRVLTVCPGQTDTELWEGKAPAEVRARMMNAGSVGELVVSLVGLDRAIDVDPVFVRPVADPWSPQEEA